MKFPRLLFLGVADYANLAHRIARGCNAFAGEQIARVWVLEQHPLGYQEDIVGGYIHRELLEVADACDWLITTGDGDYQGFESMVQSLSVADPSMGGSGKRSKRFAVTHAGSAYRFHHEAFNQDEPRFGADVRFVGCDSMRFARGAMPATFPFWPSCDPVEPPAELAYAPYPDAIDVEHRGRIVVSHSPSRRLMKGTEEILAAFTRIQQDWPHAAEYDTIEGVSFTDALARRARAHVFVDQINPDVGGFGASAIEAMAQGCAVLCDVRHVDVSAMTALGIDPPPIIHVSDGHELEHELRTLLQAPAYLHARRGESLEWARRWAAPARVGEYFLGRLAAVEEALRAKEAA